MKNNKYFVVTYVTAILLCVACTLSSVSCKNQDEETSILLTVSSEPSFTVQSGVKPDEYDVRSCIVVMENGSNIEQKIALDAIEGFSYEKGYEYLLKVKKADKDILVPYSLIELVTKTQVDNEQTIVLLNVSTDPNPLIFSDPPPVVVKEEGSEIWQRIFHLEGFIYENGFDYLLSTHKTIVNMPAVSGIPSLTIYALVEIISKTPQVTN